MDIVIRPDDGEVVHINGTWLGNKSVSIRVDNPQAWQVGNRAEVVYTALYEGADSTVTGVVNVTKK